MAYSELIKNFSRIRNYMREFYVYGFKSRDEYTEKSARTYDDERRRLESWLGDYLRFRQTPDGKNVFLSIDSRITRHNPLYKAWKAKSFTDGDITLHFILFDILYSPDIELSLKEITEKIDGYLSSFDEPRMFDESTVRKKLKEYVSEGIIITRKSGKTVLYRRAELSKPCNTDMLDFFSEVAPCGVIGSYLLDKEGAHDENFAFKHHYITAAMDSEIVCAALAAMSEKRRITLETLDKNKEAVKATDTVPLRIMISAQNGRQYLIAYDPYFKRIKSFRTDNILSIKEGEVCGEFDALREKLDQAGSHIWGVSAKSKSGKQTEHVEFTVRYGKDELFIHNRLEREKRCGRVEKLDVNTSRFSAELYDSGEIIPWIRTFICRITDISFSNKALEERFKKDLDEMYSLYGLEGGEGK